MKGFDAFRGKVAIVTGAASGLGKGFAATIAGAGGVVVAADIAEAALARAVADLGEAGARVEAHRLDVRDRDAVTTLVDDTVGRHGRIDYIFNNAGIATQGPVEDIPLDNWDEIVDINLKGVVYGTAAAYRHMVRQRSGHIVNTASLAGLIPSALLAPYSTVKFAVVGLSDALRIEARAHGVRVTALCPGFIESGIYDAARTTSALDGKGMREQLPQIVPLDVGVRRLLEGVLRDKRVVTLPAYAHVLWWTYKLFPDLFLRISGGIAAKQLEAARRAGAAAPR